MSRTQVGSVPQPVQICQDAQMGRVALSEIYQALFGSDADADADNDNQILSHPECYRRIMALHFSKCSQSAQSAQSAQSNTSSVDLKMVMEDIAQTHFQITEAVQQPEFQTHQHLIHLYDTVVYTAVIVSIRKQGRDVGEAEMTRLKTMLGEVWEKFVGSTS